MQRSLDESRGDGAMGVDFGTTNSAIATVVGPNLVSLANFETANGPSQTFPSILYFEPRQAASSPRPSSCAGAAATTRYLEAEERGRLIQSLKAYLADRRFDGTAVFGRRYSLEDMIALILHHMLAAASRLPGSLPRRVVVGRPVHFSSARNDADDAYAQSRLLTAVERCGFAEVVFEYEPVAAAYSYEQGLGHDELILIGDFGGGTSDFSILHVGPGVKGRGRTRGDILGSDGVALAGDAFDKQIIRNVVAPRLGMGSEYLSPPSNVLPVPSWPYARLERWHHLSFLNTPKTVGMLTRIRQTASSPERLGAFIHLIEGELGYQLHEAVRRTKFALSEQEEAPFEFHCEPIDMRTTVTRAQFDRWIEPELSAIAACVDGLLGATGIAPDDIDHVFLTGGSSFVPAVRRLFTDRFGSPKITGGKELTSVATGLALRAAEEWSIPAAASSR